MTRVNRSADCGNSPKNKMAEDIAVALETRDIDFLSTILDADAVWNDVSGTASTAEAILNEIKTLTKPPSLTIDRVMTHGKVGAVNGNAGKGKRVQRFCHVIEFSSVKCNRVRRIESYSG